MIELVLYGTSCCHLCEEAEAVLRRTFSGAELGWPFDVMAVVQFLA